MKRNTAWTIEIILKIRKNKPPKSPKKLQARLGGKGDRMQVRLNWQDKSNNEDGFHVYRADDGGSAVLLTDVGENVTEHIDTSVESGHTYVYVVTAFNSAGESGPSNEATVTLEAAETAPEAPTDLTATLEPTPPPATPQQRR